MLAGIKATRQAQEQLFNELDPNMDGVLDYKVNPRHSDVINLDPATRCPLPSASPSPSPSYSLIFSTDLQEFVDGILGNDSNLAGSEGMMNLRDDWIQKVVWCRPNMSDASHSPRFHDRASRTKHCRVKCYKSK